LREGVGNTNIRNKKGDLLYEGYGKESLAQTKSRKDAK
jgi:hypothetical protein